METVKNNQKEAEKPPQSEVADLSTEVEPMDADDGLDLDPYSPASNLNTEEMEELLRVEEEILNSPEKANEAPKTGKEGRTRLSGAARRRLQHFKAKGLPFEQALALAKQPMQKPCKRLHAETSRKRERSANTTPETNMPKRGGATGAGTIPARVVEVATESADQQAEKPMTPRPTAATITREHRSYSEVTSAERFAVIPMGYPKALFSTKELSRVQEAILDVIRTQRQGAIKPYFTGCTFRPGWLLISCANKETADWLKETVPELKPWTGAKMELVAEANMPKPQVYIGYFPKTEKYSNEDILQLLEGQNRALRIGDWRILNRVDRGKQIELTFSVDPLSDEQLKSVGYRLCYGFGQVHIRQRSKHSAEAKNAPAVAMPVSGKEAQTSLDSLELPTCSKSLTPTTCSSGEQSSEAAGSNMAAPTPNAATTERPTVSAPQVARLRPPLYGRLQHKQGKGARRSAEETVLLGGNRGRKRAARANLHHAKAASDVLSCRFATEDLDVAFLQEPWILSGKIKGLNTKNGRLIYASEQQRPRAALLLNKKVTFVPLSQFTTEDLVAVWAKMPTACGEQEAVIASAYFPGDSNDAPPREVGALVEYCQRENLRWIIGCDANAHHTVWGSTNTNNRAIAWWTKVTQRKAKADLSKLQRLVCVGMTGAMSTCPTDALGIITGISPLPILIEKEACLGALRLQGVANLKSGNLTGHLKVLETFFTSPIVHLSDVQLPNMIFKRNFTVSIKDRSSWNNPNLCIPSGSQVWYTDGSKLENGDTGAGVYGPRFRMSIAMGKTPSIFQAEIHAIEVCAIECIRRRMQGPEPFCGLARGHTMEVIRNWEEKKLSKYWLDSVGQRQAKRFLIPAKNLSKRMVELRKSDLRILTGYLTGHCSLRYHLKKLNLSETETCRFCELEQETSEHILCECPALCRCRIQILGCVTTPPYKIWEYKPSKVLKFIKSLNF
ncbi:hypothetical protein ACLKA7_001249 [Drosophila subpalustris]